jgi:AcrR family transcriptional regulator
MGRDATVTRARLLRAGERRFARDGVLGARLADVVRDAGQANDSAVGYHFGSRQGLLAAIIDRHVDTMERTRRESLPDLPSLSVPELVRVIVVPTAALLRAEEGRDFLRIAAQLADWSGVRSGHPAEAIRGTAIAAQLGRLEELLRERLPVAVARERVAAVVTFLTAALAERARAVESGRRQALGHTRYVEHLVAMLAAAAGAAAPS